MKDAPSIVGTSLGFSAGVVGLASAFVLIVASAVMRSSTSHGVPTVLDYGFGVAALCLLILSFIATVVVLRRAAWRMPSTRAGFVAGLAGVTMLLCTMMLAGETLGMRGSLIVAMVAGVASAAGAMRAVAPSKAQSDASSSSAVSLTRR